MSYWDQSIFGVKTRNTTGIMEVSLTALFNFLITFKLTLAQCELLGSVNVWRQDKKYHWNHES